MKKYLGFILLSLSALVIASCGSPAGKAAEKPAESPAVLEEAEESAEIEKLDEDIEIGIAPNMKAPDFKLLDSNEEEISLSDYKGKVVFLNFWATTCPYCVDEMPDLETFYHRHKDEEDFAILGINMTKTWEKKSKEQLVNWLEAEGITFPVVFDEDGDLAAQWAARSLPMTFIINQDGISLGAIMGQTDIETLEKVLEEVRAAY